MNIRVNHVMSNHDLNFPALTDFQMSVIFEVIFVNWTIFVHTMRQESKLKMGLAWNKNYHKAMKYNLNFTLNIPKHFTYSYNSLMFV